MAVKKKKYQFIVNIYSTNNQKVCLIHRQFKVYVKKKYSHRVTINKLYMIINAEKINMVFKFKYQFTITIYSTDDFKAELIYNQLKDYTFRIYGKRVRINKLYKMIDIEKEKREKEEKELLKTMSNVSRLIKQYSNVGKDGSAILIGNSNNLAKKNNTILNKIKHSNIIKEPKVEVKQIFGFPLPLNDEIKIGKRTYQKQINED